MTSCERYDIINHMNYCHKRSFSLRWTDLDFKDELKLSSLLSIAQEVAGSSADELHFGYGDLVPKGLGFFVTATHCELLRPVRAGETLTAETWPLPPRHVVFERDYRIKVGGETVANLASRWCLVDLKTFRLLTPDALGKTHAECPYNSEKALEVADWKIPKLNGEGKEVYRMRVGSSQCDHYSHANNTRYADFFLDCYTMKELAELPVKAFRIYYGKQATENAELVFTRKDFDNGTSVCEAHSNGELISRFLLKFA